MQIVGVRAKVYVLPVDHRPLVIQCLFLTQIVYMYKYIDLVKHLQHFESPVDGCCLRYRSCNLQK